MEGKGEGPQHVPPTEDAKSTEAKTSAEEAKEALARMTPTERASHSLGAAIGIIKEKTGQGFFAGDDKQIAREKAEKAIGYTGKEGDIKNSSNLRAIFETLDTIGGEGKEISDVAAEKMTVRVEGVVEGLTWEKWKAELGLAKQIVDGSLPNAERIKQLEAGEFGYDFPKEEAGERNIGADSLINQKLTEIEGKKDKSEDDKKLLIMLRLAKRAEGKMSVLIKERALRYLNILDSESGAGEIVERMKEETKQAREKLNVLLQNNGWNENKIMGFNNALDSGGIDSLISQGELEKIVGLRDALFGKDADGRSISDDELQKLLDPEHKRDWSKIGNLLGILFALMFAADISKQVLSAENR